MSKTYSHAEVMNLVATAKESERLIWREKLEEKNERIEELEKSLWCTATQGAYLEEQLNITSNKIPLPKSAMRKSRQFIAVGGEAEITALTKIYDERVKVVMDALIRHHENQCHWQGQDPKDHETYYEEGYPEINKIFENHYGYVEPNFDE